MNCWAINKTEFKIQLKCTVELSCSSILRYSVVSGAGICILLMQHWTIRLNTKLVCHQYLQFWSFIWYSNSNNFSGLPQWLRFGATVFFELNFGAGFSGFLRWSMLFVHVKMMKVSHPTPDIRQPTPFFTYTSSLLKSMRQMWIRAKNRKKYESETTERKMAESRTLIFLISYSFHCSNFWPIKSIPSLYIINMIMYTSCCWARAFQPNCHFCQSVSPPLVRRTNVCYSHSYKAPQCKAFPNHSN